MSGFCDITKALTSPISPVSLFLTRYGWSNVVSSSLPPATIFTSWLCSLCFLETPTIFTSSSQSQETKNRKKLVPRKCVRTRQASASPAQRSPKRSLRVESENNDIQKASDDQAETEENKRK